MDMRASTTATPFLCRQLVGVIERAAEGMLSIIVLTAVLADG